MLPETRNGYELADLIEQTIAETKQYIEKFPEIKVYANILDQLLFIKQILIVEKRKPTFMEINSTYVGSIAIKNFEDNPQYSAKLQRISYLFCEYKDISFLKNSLK